jgi:hypothetical protein
MSLVKNSYFDHLYSRPECHLVSKALSISKNTAALNILLLKFMVMWSTRLIYWSDILCSALKPNWLTFSEFLSSVCFCVVHKISFSHSLPIVDKRLIGLKFWGNFRSLPGFCGVTIFASFQGAGSDKAESSNWVNVLTHKRSSNMLEIFIWNAFKTTDLS